MTRYLSSLPLPAKKALKLVLVTQTLAYLGGMDNFFIMVDIRLPLFYPYVLYLVPFYSLATIYVAHRHGLFGRNTQAVKSECSIGTVC